MTYINLVMWTLLATLAYTAMVAIGCIAVLIGTPIACTLRFLNSSKVRISSKLKSQALQLHISQLDPAALTQTRIS
jgi:hypothetical protein